MPWTCPKCGLRVGHGNPEHPLPRPGVLYRCPVCRLELTFDPATNKMRPAPSRSESSFVTGRTSTRLTSSGQRLRGKPTPVRVVRRGFKTDPLRIRAHELILQIRARRSGLANQLEKLELHMARARA